MEQWQILIDELNRSNQDNKFLKEIVQKKVHQTKTKTTKSKTTLTDSGTKNTKTGHTQVPQQKTDRTRNTQGTVKSF